VGPQEEFPCEDCGKVFLVAMRLYGHMSQCAARLRRLGKHPDLKGAKVGDDLSVSGFTKPVGRRFAVSV
jgi:hypothetical protein